MIFARAISHPVIEAIADPRMPEHGYIAVELDDPWDSEGLQQMALAGFVDDLAN